MWRLQRKRSSFIQLFTFFSKCSAGDRHPKAWFDSESGRSVCQVPAQTALFIDLLNVIIIQGQRSHRLFLLAQRNLRWITDGTKCIFCCCLSCVHWHCWRAVVTLWRQKRFVLEQTQQRGLCNIRLSSPWVISEMGRDAGSGQTTGLNAGRRKEREEERGCPKVWLDQILLQ